MNFEEQMDQEQMAAEIEAFGIEEKLPNGRTHAEQAGHRLIREHSKPVRQALQRAGLSQQSELTADEVRRAEESIQKFSDKYTLGSKIRHYIMPPAAQVEEEEN